MIMFDYRVGGWVKKCQNIDYVIFERSLTAFSEKQLTIQGSRKCDCFECCCTQTFLMSLLYPHMNPLRYNEFLVIVPKVVRIQYYAPTILNLLCNPCNFAQKEIKSFLSIAQNSTFSMNEQISKVQCHKYYGVALGATKIINSVLTFI